MRVRLCVSPATPPNSLSSVRSTRESRWSLGSTFFRCSYGTPISSAACWMLSRCLNSSTLAGCQPCSPSAIGSYPTALAGIHACRGPRGHKGARQRSPRLVVRARYAKGVQLHDSGRLPSASVVWINHTCLVGSQRLLSHRQKSPSIPPTTGILQPARVRRSAGISEACMEVRRTRRVRLLRAATWRKQTVSAM